MQGWLKSEAYDELSDQVDAGQLRLISLLAPARSSSTALERAMLQSPSIHFQINDPFALYDTAEREEKTYEYIGERIEEFRLQHKGPLTVLVKNIADYIPPGICWARWRDLCSHHIFLIRNPLLTLHSLFKMMVRHYKGAQVAVEPLSMDEYARGKGFCHWAELQKKLSHGNDFAEYEELYRALFTRDQKIHHENVMRIPVLLHIPMQLALDAGYRSLDAFAATLGHSDWDATKQYLTTPNPRLAGFEKILDRVFACRITGWEALYQHFMQTTNAFVMDSTMFRAAPGSVMRAIAQAACIEYADSMQAWGNKVAKRFSTDYDGEVPYYDRIVKSQGIDPPLEKPLALAAFPPLFRHHLTEREGCFDIYLRLLDRMATVFAASFTLSAELAATDPVFAQCLHLVFPGRFPAVQDARFDDLFVCLSRFS
jgi:hypothetical protein